MDFDINVGGDALGFLDVLRVYLDVAVGEPRVSPSCISSIE